MDKKYLNFRSPIEILSAPPSKEGLLIGDRHITKGAVTVIGGAPGVGKSRVATSLAVAGATGQDWFGLKVNRKFKTMILQCENGAWRLYSEMSDIEGIEDIDQYLLVSDPPAYGIRLDDIGFREQFLAAIEKFQPDVIVVDPWNAVVTDDKAKDFREAFDAFRGLTEVDELAPALVIIHHTRKPKDNEKHSGRSLMNLFAGSYVFVSVPRSAFILQAGSNDPEDDRVVMTCCKNNDGELGERTAWHRKNGLFDPATDFDWGKFDKAEGGAIATALDKIKTILDEGRLSGGELISEALKRFGLKKSAAYKAAKELVDSKLAFKTDAGLFQLK